MLDPGVCHAVNIVAPEPNIDPVAVSCSGTMCEELVVPRLTGVDQVAPLSVVYETTGYHIPGLGS